MLRRDTAQNEVLTVACMGRMRHMNLDPGGGDVIASVCPSCSRPTVFFTPSSSSLPSLERVAPDRMRRTASTASQSGGAAAGGSAPLSALSLFAGVMVLVAFSPPPVVAEALCRSFCARTSAARASYGTSSHPGRVHRMHTTPVERDAAATERAAVKTCFYVRSRRRAPREGDLSPRTPTSYAEKGDFRDDDVVRVGAASPPSSDFVVRGRFALLGAWNDSTASAAAPPRSRASSSSRSSGAASSASSPSPREAGVPSVAGDVVAAAPRASSFRAAGGRDA